MKIASPVLKEQNGHRTSPTELTSSILGHSSSTDKIIIIKVDLPTLLYSIWKGVVLIFIRCIQICLAHLRVLNPIKKQKTWKLSKKLQKFEFDT